MRYLLILVLLGIAEIAHAQTCAILPRTNTGTQTVELLIAPTALTVSGVACYCAGDCVSPIATFSFADRAGNAVSLASTLTCATGTGNSTWTSFTGPNASLITGEGFEVSVSNSPASEDRVTLCVRFS